MLNGDGVDVLTTGISRVAMVAMSRFVRFCIYYPTMFFSAVIWSNDNTPAIALI